MLQFIDYVLNSSDKMIEIKRHAKGLKDAMKKNNDWKYYEEGILRMAFMNYDELLLVSKHLTTNDTRECNGELKDGAYERKNEKLERFAEELAEKMGLMAYHQTDPRGCALYIGHDLTDLNYTKGIAIL